MIRLAFDFNEKTLEEIDFLKEACGFQNRAELMRHACRFLQWAYDETQNKGRTLILEKGG